MISAERRIYQKSPAPTNQELADGLNALLDEHGETTRTRQFGGILNTFTTLKIPLGNSLGNRAIIDIDRDDTSGLTIVNSYFKASGEKFYSSAPSIAIHDDPSEVKVWTGKRNILHNELPDTGRKIMGEIVLMCWEKLNQNTIPSKR